MAARTLKKLKKAKKKVITAKKGNHAMNSWELFDAAASVDSETRILVWGPKGLAKSRHSQMVLGRHHNTVAQISLNDDIAAQELMGHYIPKGDHFVWHHGPVMEAYKDGHGLVINELGRASGAVQDLFLSVLDDPAVSMITLPNGEHVKPGKGFQVIATSNHDPSLMDEALVDRFDTIIHVTTPHPDLIAYLNGALQGLGTIVADSYIDEARSISPRRALAYLLFVKKGIANENAASLAFGSRAKDIYIAIKSLTGKKAEAYA